MKIEDLHIGQTVIVNDGLDCINEEATVIGITAHRRPNVWLRFSWDHPEGCTDGFLPEHLEPKTEETSDDVKIVEYVASKRGTVTLDEVKSIFEENKDLQKTFRFCDNVLEMGYNPRSFRNMLTK